MEIIGIIAAIIVVILVVFYFILLRGNWPKKSSFYVDFEKVRELAKANKTELPKSINRLLIANGELPSWGVVAGDFSGKYKIEFPSFQLTYEDKTIIIEVPYNKRLFDKFPYGKEFFPDNYETMQKALNEAELIIPTHEHWDHIGGVAQSENYKKLLQKTVLTKKQINGPTIKDAEFHENAFDNYQELEYTKYHKISPGVVLIDAPGHSVGHQFIFISLQNQEEFLFTGDVVWVMENFRKKKARPWLANKKRFENRRQIAHQMKWIFDEFIANKEQKIHMLATHDPEQHQSFIKAGLIHEGFIIKEKNKNKKQ